MSEVRKRLEDATPGPWTLFNTYEDGICVDIDCPATHADMKLIANAPTDLRRLLARHCVCKLNELVAGLIPCETCRCRKALARLEKLCSGDE